MANEKLELTFTGLCVMVIKGPAGTVNPPFVDLRLIDDGRSVHQPRLSFRGIDLGDVSSGGNDPVSIRVGPDGQEIVDMPIVARAVSVTWEFGAQDSLNTLTWEESDDSSMTRIPDLQDFNVKEIHRDGTNTSTMVTLPFGQFEAREIVRARGGRLHWAFDGIAGSRVYANQVVLISEASLGADLLVTVGDRTFHLLSGDGSRPLRIGITNLPAAEKLIEPEIPVGGTPSHLLMYQRIVKTEMGSGFRAFKRTFGATRQGSICPVVRAHV
jgi:hypothetical protein